MKIHFSLLALVVCISCNQITSNQSNISDSLSFDSQPATISPLKSIIITDSFVRLYSSQILKNDALRETYGQRLTNELLPLIIKHSLYDDVPFKLTATTIDNGNIYGNFIYEDQMHYIKVTGIIKKSQIDSLEEDKNYYIKYKFAELQFKASFKEDAFSLDTAEPKKIENIILPQVGVYITSFKQIN